MTNIVATSISSKITASEKQAVRTNIDVEKGIRDYQAYIDSLFAKATLDLNFVTNEHKVYEAFGPTNKVITDAITTARNSTALYDSPIAAGISAAINTPRVEYDPLTGAPLGLLVEEARTNLALQSQDFTTTWLQSPDAPVNVESNTITAPDGTLTADKFIEADTTNTFHDLYQSISYTAGITYCFSVYLKASERSKVTVFYGATGAFTTERRITVDLIAKTFTIWGIGATGGIFELPNGWFRVWITGVADVTGVTPTIIRLLDNTGTVTYPGVINSGIFVWGAQVEAGSFPSSYIPTTTIALQRQTDVISRVLSAVPQGTLLCLCSGGIPTVGLNQAGFVLTDGTTNNRVVLRRNNATGGTQYLVIAAGAIVAQVNTTQKPAGQFNAFGMSWRQDRFLASEDGINVMEDLAGATPVNLTQLGIGSSGPAFVGVDALNGTIKRLVYIPQSLNKSEIDALTAYLKAQG